MSATYRPLAARDKDRRLPGLDQPGGSIDVRGRQSGGAVASGERPDTTLPTNREAVRCGRCGLVIFPRAGTLAPAHCPRCLVRGRLTVKLETFPTETQARGSLPRSPVAQRPQESTEQTGRLLDAADETPRLGALASRELDVITRDIASRAGAEMGLLAVFNRANRSVEILCASGAALGGEHLPSLRADGFAGRVLESGHAAVESLDHDPGLGIPRSGARLTYAAGAAVRPPGGPPGALCVGFAAAPQDRELTIWLLEGYARLAALCLHDAGTLAGLIASARSMGRERRHDQRRARV